MPAGWPRRLAVATITIGLMMSVLSNSMTNLALPYIAQDLNITAESSIWIVNATQIALIISLLPVAALADIVGYRHVYRFGLVLFPLFVVIALLVRDRRQGLILGGLSTAGLVLLTMQFAQWYWVS